jgi:hypothetical protein
MLNDVKIEKPNRTLRPDSQPFDEIRTVTIPRFKDSELSGSEWRISAHTQFLRKGKVVYEYTTSNIEYAVRLMDAKFIDCSEGNGAYYAGEANLCDQEGCSEEASVVYRLKKRYSREGMSKKPYGTEVRYFCERHKHRGDCGREDADDNYELFLNLPKKESS